ncbi:helix-turn-helix transcriptional regulator [Porphyromonas endodontalis]|jgi:transcriptional regulator with XRE-family HTH domain|uniref:helix-turn-helix domain-containing protein n=1 Tax=Porphyromonas endodontalis TaxID=28124 RepID=UPI0028E67629|nr:helix-turn-helix transcriptional regulator [Porphyromonas endodontalis]
MTNKEFGAILRTLREESGITQYRLIKDKIVTSATQLQDIEEARRDVRLSTLLRLLEAYGKEIKIIDKGATDTAK